MMNSKQIRRLSIYKSKLKESPNNGYEASTPLGDVLSMYVGSPGPGGIVQNSYKLTPDRNFPVKEVQEILESTLNEHFKDKKYEDVKCSDLCPSLSRIIQYKVKGIGLRRYKLVTMVYIGENRGQSARVTSRCLWNEKYDSYASASYYSETIFAQATVYGVYLE